MISHIHKFLFIHRPKTGGNSIQRVLAPFSEDQLTSNRPNQDGVERFGIKNPDDDRLRKHSTMDEYYQVYGDKVFKYQKIIVIRNPFDRLVSSYFSANITRKEFTTERFKAMVMRIEPLERFISINGKIVDMDTYIRFEDLETDLNETLNTLGLEMTALPHVNKSNRPSYQDCYDEELKAYVAQRHKFEIDLGGYEF